MELSEYQRSVLCLCALTVNEERCDWGVIARQCFEKQSPRALLDGHVVERTARAQRTSRVIGGATSVEWGAAEAKVDAELQASAGVGARVVTVLDQDYPLNLRLVHNLPPFLFYRGELDAFGDALSVAVVGARRASGKGLERADRMARQLVEHGVTVTSGLARGVDSAAHRSALAAGGRTVAVFGTGITTVYPPENAMLADEIVDKGGAVVSQFFPSAGAAKWTFRARNVVTSGISQGSVVIEASKTSGAKMQARLAVEHGKQVFLLESLVQSQSWAQTMIEERKAICVRYVGDVIKHLASPDRIQTATNSLPTQPSLV